MLYDRLRLRFYSDTGSHRTPPPSTAFQWYWLPERSPLLACTHFDEDGEPFSIGLNPMHRRVRVVLRVSLMHELSHMRLGADSSCEHNSKAWKQEAVRLALLGAPLL